MTQTLELVNLDEDLNKADDIAQNPPKKKKGKPLKCGPIWKGKKKIVIGIPRAVCKYCKAELTGRVVNRTTLLLNH